MIRKSSYVYGTAVSLLMITSFWWPELNTFTTKIKVIILILHLLKVKPNSVIKSSILYYHGNKNKNKSQRSVRPHYNATYGLKCTLYIVYWKQIYFTRRTNNFHTKFKFETEIHRKYIGILPTRETPRRRVTGWSIW